MWHLESLLLIALDRPTARRVIAHLKAGSTPLDCVEYINVGNERWHGAASTLFDDVQTEADSVVRFINGYYGDGKTHFLGMLRSIAFGKGWMATYVTAESTPLHKFDVVYSEIVKNLALPPQLQVLQWLSPSVPRGATALLGALFSRFYFEAYRLPDRGGMQKERVIAALRKKTMDLAADPGLHAAMGSAVRAYVEAILRSDSVGAHAVCSWFEGSVVPDEAPSLSRRIDQRMSRDATRGISVIARRAGAGGVLLLLDEAERIMEQSRSVRAKSYGVIRDLLDNTDNQGGMQSSITYVAGTPDLYRSEKGFPEYDALRSRLSHAFSSISTRLVDWRGTVVDLTRTPLPRDTLAKLADRILELHAIARDWRPSEYFGPVIIDKMITSVESQAVLVTKPRLLSSWLASMLDVVEQNRDQPADSVLGEVLQSVQAALSEKKRAQLWD